jgi:AcrR family transcriptional regulator
MTTLPPIRDRLLAAMAAHVLRHGLTGASLRPLARAAGTSDRMLIYHFGSKDRLVAALLLRLADDFRDLLETLTPAGRFPSADAAVTRIVAAQMRPEMADYLRLWLEIVAAAGRGGTAHRDTGRAILTHLEGWLAGRLPADDPDPDATARAALVRIEGEVLLWALGMPGR